MLIESIVTFVCIIAVLVVFHEAGHFAAARLVGVRVDEFAIGFGPKLLRLFKRGDTEYTIHPIPLGGFVKLAGMEPGQEDISDGFQAQAAWKRAFVIFSGPFMSFVLGAIVFVVIGIHWGYPDPFAPRNQIGQVYPNTEAARIGLRAGDRILKIDGAPIEQGVDMVSLIHDKPGQSVRLVVQRNHTTLKKTGTPRWLVRFLDADWSFMGGGRAAVGDNLTPGTAGAKALKPGDTLIRFNGKAMRGGKEMTDAIAANDGKPAKLELLRGGKNVTVTTEAPICWVRYLNEKWVFPGAYVEGTHALDPKSKAGKLGLQRGDSLISIDGRKVKTGEQMISLLTASGNKPAKLLIAGREKEYTITAPGLQSHPPVGYYDAMGLLGFTPAPSLKKTSFEESVKRGILVTAGYATQMVKTFTSKERLQTDVGGPVMIAKATATSVALGPYWVMFELGALSLSLAFINLLPIPVLDGGHLMIILVEAIRRKRLTLQQMATVQVVGLAIIATLVAVVIFSDVSKIVGGNLPQ